MKRHIGKLEEIIRTVMVEEPSFRIRPVGKTVPESRRTSADSQP
jgi:hypothetical protein